MAEPMFPVQARDVHVAFGSVQALRGVSLEVPQGVRLAVLGPNGAGKSVLLRVLHGLVKPSAGSVTFAGRPARAPSQAMVFQRPVMLRRAVLDNVMYALRLRGVPAPEALGLAFAALDRVGLAHLAERQARVLSFGEQQRVALARAWALEPSLLLLDEPTSSLDPTAAAEVERIVGEIHAAGTTVVMTTHNLGLARRYATEIAFLAEGRLTERTPAARFFRAPASREADQYLQEELP